MEIKDHLRLAESWWEQVTRLGIIEAATCVGNQLALVIVDLIHDSMAQESRTGIVADPKPGRRGRVNRTLVQVWMPAQVEGERQPWQSIRAAVPCAF
jgi:hypothetical protein